MHDAVHRVRLWHVRPQVGIRRGEADASPAERYSSSVVGSVMASSRSSRHAIADAIRSHLHASGCALPRVAPRPRRDARQCARLFAPARPGLARPTLDGASSTSPIRASSASGAVTSRDRIASARARSCSPRCMLIRSIAIRRRSSSRSTSPPDSPGAGRLAHRTLRRAADDERCSLRSPRLAASLAHCSPPRESERSRGLRAAVPGRRRRYRRRCRPRRDPEEDDGEAEVMSLGTRLQRLGAFRPALQLLIRPASTAVGARTVRRSSTRVAESACSRAAACCSPCLARRARRAGLRIP